MSKYYDEHNVRFSGEVIRLQCRIFELEKQLLEITTNIKDLIKLVESDELGFLDTSYDPPIYSICESILEKEIILDKLKKLLDFK